MSKTAILLLSFCIFSVAIAMDFEELTKDVFDKINLLRTRPFIFTLKMDANKYDKLWRKIWAYPHRAKPLKLSQGLSLAVAHRG